jgi:nitroimidazol reductase NimA-like FMN-containing flavoprotein (pyridoxamine 5'-phosphate oxidase superfamily)
MSDEQTAPAPAVGGPRSDRVRLRRKRERGSYDREAIDAILDEGLVAHLGVVAADGQPIVTPTLHARRGDIVYFHGSAASRTLRLLAAGAPACLTVTLIDGLVLARAAMHHSANYRSVILLGRAQLVEDSDEKLAASEAIVEQLVPGRWADVRPPNENELKATAIVAMPIDEASAKVRTGPPLDDAEDLTLRTWAGVVPLELRAGVPETDPLLAGDLPVPDYAAGYARNGRPRPRR